MSKSSLLGVVFATYFRVGSYGLGGNPQGPGGPRASTGHNHLSAISSRPSNHGVLCFRLRARQGRGGGCVCSREVSFFPNHGTPPQVSNGYDLLSWFPRSLRTSPHELMIRASSFKRGLLEMF